MLVLVGTITYAPSDIEYSLRECRVVHPHTERASQACLIAGIRAQLAGVSYVEGEDASLVHCQFGEMADCDELELSGLVSEVIGSNTASASTYSPNRE